MALSDADSISSSKLYRIKLYRFGDEPEIVVIVGTNCISEYNSKYNTDQIVCVRAGFNSIEPIGPCAYKGFHTRVIYSRLFKYTQHTLPVLQRTAMIIISLWGPHLLRETLFAVP